MTSRLRRLFVTIAFVRATTLGASHAGAQAANEHSEAPTPTDTANAIVEADADAPLDSDAVDRATWAARLEYHRQLRRVDLSELGSAASSLGYGIYSLTRDERFSRGLGGALVAGGSVHLVSGIIFSIRSQRGMSPTDAPGSFREGDPLARELEEMERRSELFIAYLLGDTSVIAGAITTTMVGVARDEPATQGVGLGLASQGVLTLVLDLVHQNQGRVYLRNLRDLQLRVERPHAARGAIATFGWTL